jgi:hypothetical protein
MPVHFLWDDPEKTILRYEFIGKWTWEELYETIHASWDEVKQLDYIVDSIGDVSGTDGVPPSVITHVRSLSQNRPENTDLMVFVGANAYLNAIMQTFSQISQNILRRDINIVMAKTLDEARELVAERKAKREQEASE